MTCDIFIRSHSADFEWLKYCLRSIQRFATGFRRTVVVVPTGQIPPTGTAETVFYVERYGDDYLLQQSTKLHADAYADAEFILFTDSDTIFTRPISPPDMIEDLRRPKWLYTAYCSLGNDESQLWKNVTAKAVREPVEHEFMRRHPFIVRRTMLVEFRQWMLREHGMTLERYIMSQPAHEFSEWNALGAWLWLHRRNEVEWINTADDSTPTFVHQHYSWGGLSEAIQANMEAALV